MTEKVEPKPNPFKKLGEEWAAITDAENIDVAAVRKMMNRRLSLRRNLLRKYSGHDFAAWWLNEDNYQLTGIGLESEDRAEVMLAIHVQTGADIVELCKANWTSCDAFYKWNDEFKKIFIQKNVKVEDTLHMYDRDWFNSLPEKLTIYRGCTKGRQDGICWTADRSVAESFAEGHRGIKNAQPMVYEETINKFDAFFAFNDRREQEIVWRADIDPKTKQSEMDI